MLLFITLFSAAAIFLLILGIFTLRTPEKVDVNQRLQDTIGLNEKEVDIREMELQNSFADRAIRPLLGKITRLVNKLLPGTMLSNLEPKISRAGNPGGLTAEEFLAVKLVTTVGFILLASLISISRGGLDLFTLALLALGVVGGWLLPDFYLQNLASKRLQEIDRSMPDVLDLLTVSIEAGYSWDGALQKLIQKKKGPLSSEFRRVLQEAKMGKPRRDALRTMAERVNVPSLTTFVAAVVQADQLGLSLGEVLRTQSDQIRQKRRQEIEEEAMKTPIKILIPLVFFVFPAIFIVLLGPALVQIMDIF